MGCTLLRWTSTPGSISENPSTFWNLRRASKPHIQHSASHWQEAIIVTFATTNRKHLNNGRSSSSSHQVQGFPSFVGVSGCLTTEKKSTGSVSIVIRFCSLPKGSITAKIRAYAKKQEHRTELYKKLLQVAGTTRLEFLHLLRHLPQVEETSNWIPSGSEYPTKRLLHQTDPNSFYTGKPEGRLHQNSLPMFNWLHLFPHQKSDICSQNQTLPFG